MKVSPVRFNNVNPSKISQVKKAGEVLKSCLSDKGFKAISGLTGLAMLAGIAAIKIKPSNPNLDILEQYQKENPIEKPVVDDVSIARNNYQLLKSKLSYAEKNLDEDKEQLKQINNILKYKKDTYLAQESRELTDFVALDEKEIMKYQKEIKLAKLDFYRQYFGEKLE